MIPLLAGLLGLGLFRVANAEVHRFERLAAESLSSRLSGDHRRVVVRADVGPEALFGDVHAVAISAEHFSSEQLPFLTEPKRSQRGLLRSFFVDLSDFKLRGLHVDRLHLDIPDCRFDFAAAAGRHEFHLTRSGTGTAQVEVSAGDLGAFILYKYRNVKTVQVRIDRDKVFLDGQATFIAVSTHFEVVARLETSDGIHLNLARAKILLEGRPADPAFAETLLRTINPVVDLNLDLGLSDAVHVQNMILRDGVLRASGSVAIPSKQ